MYTFKVTARNTVGNSLFSETISIRAAEVPDAPLYLSNVESVTTAYQVGLLWQEGNYNGGSVVLDYRVGYAEEFSSDFVIFADDLTTTSLTVTGLTPGVYYWFRVEARNIVGYSEFSDPIFVLAAQIPDPPTGLVNVPAITNAN